MLKKIYKNILKFCLLAFVFVGINEDVFAKSNFDYVYTIKTTNFDFKPQKNNFLDSLAREYKSYAIYKNEKTDDFDGANFFAKKSLQAYTGKYVKPYDVYKLNMNLATAAHIYRIYDDLMFLFSYNLNDKYPVLMANAQAKFDCFIDNEVLKNNKKQASVCYKKFTETMAILNKKLDEVCDGKCKLARQESNIGIKLAKNTNLKSSLQKTRKRSNLKDKEHNPQLNRYVAVYPLNDIDKLKEEKLLVKNEAFVRPIGKKVVNNDFVIPVKQDVKGEFMNTVAGVDLQKDAVAVKPISEQDVKISTDISIIDNSKETLTDIQKKLQEIEQKIDILSKKNCNCNLDDIRKDLSNLANKADIIKETDDNKNAVASLGQETKNLETKIEDIENENIVVTDDNKHEEPVVSIETEVTEEVDIIEDEKEEDNSVEDENEDKPEFQQVTEKETVETEIFDKPSNMIPYELYFDWDRDNVKPEYRTQLQDITEKALKSKETIVIQGHADNTGDERYNDDLSKRRATNVGKVVMSYGIPKEKIVLQGVGSREPKVPTKHGERNEKNRRVVIK